MIKIVQGNIFDADVEALVNPVNCVGVAGKGLALEFKRRWPEAFREYKEACDDAYIMLGMVYFYIVTSPGNPSFIIHFPTKGHWRSPSKVEWIQEGVDSLRTVIKNLRIRSIAIPALGSGLGGLDWEDVRPLIVGGLEGLDDVEILIYEPMP